MIDIDAAWSYDNMCSRSDLHAKIFHLFLSSNKSIFDKEECGSSTDVLLPLWVSENPFLKLWLGTTGVYKTLKNHDCLKHY